MALRREDEKTTKQIQIESLNTTPISDPDKDSPLIDYVTNIILKEPVSQRQFEKSISEPFVGVTNNILPKEQDSDVLNKFATGNDPVVNIERLDDDPIQNKQESNLLINKIKRNKKTIIIISVGILLSGFLLFRGKK